LSKRVEVASSLGRHREVRRLLTIGEEFSRDLRINTEFHLSSSVGDPNTGATKRGSAVSMKEADVRAGPHRPRGVTITCIVDEFALTTNEQPEHEQ